jgi:SAM-dependent methyltransferase
MPDGATVARMYGTTYGTGWSTDLDIDDPKQPLEVKRWLTRSPPGTFVDYGCGPGSLLAEARALGWQAVGLELDREVARRTADRVGAEVVTDPAELTRRFPADVLHLGDVIEHLTDLPRQFPEILRAIKPGGLLIAQGPLEGNANLFTLALRGQRLLRGAPRSSFPPYHVLLASAEGQRGFFRRAGLEELEFSVSETAWPAPSRLGRADLRKPRAVAMFVLRRASQAVSSLRPSRWGNRYFFVGRRGAAPPPAVA